MVEDYAARITGSVLAPAGSVEAEAIRAVLRGDEAGAQHIIDGMSLYTRQQLFNACQIVLECCLAVD